MAKKNSLPTLDVRLVAADYKHKNVFVNQRLIMSHVGQYAMELFRQEMISVEPLLTAPNKDGSQQHVRTTIDASVQRACDGAEKLFRELDRRGWLSLSPETDDLLAEADTQFGIHNKHKNWRVE